MDASALAQRLTAAPDTVTHLIATERLNGETVQLLRDESLRYIRNDEQNHSLTCASAALLLGEHLPAPAQQIGLWAMGNVHVIQGQYRDAVTYYQPAYHHFLEHGMMDEAYRVGMGYMAALGHVDRIEDALTVAETLTNMPQAAEHDPYNNLGIVFFQVGRYEDALFAYDEAVRFAESRKQSKRSARIQQNRARLLTELNLPEQAEQAFRAAEKPLIHHRLQTDLTRLYLNWGVLCSRLGRYDDADQKFSQSASYVGDEQEKSAEFGVLTLYQIQNKLKRLTDSLIPPNDSFLAEAQSAHRLIEGIGQTLLMGEALLALAHCHRMRQEWTKAEQVCTQINRLLERQGGQTLAWLAQWEQAQLALARGQREAAVQHLEQTTATIGQMRQAFVTTAGRTMFHVDKAVVFHTLAAVHIESGQFDDAFCVQEQVRARLLSEKLMARFERDVAQLAERPDGLNGLDGLDGDVHAQAVQLETVLSELNQLEQSQSQSGLLDDEVVLGQIAEKERQVGQLLQEIERLQPQFSPLATGFVADIETIKSLVPEDGCLLYYHQIDSMIHVMPIDQTGILANIPIAPMSDIEDAQTELDALISRAIHSPRSRQRRMFPRLLAHAQRQLERLFDMLIAPVQPYLDGMTQLVIAPVDRLFYIPFHALYDGDGERYAVERWAISYTPSGTMSYLCQQRPCDNHDVLIAGYDGGNLAAVADELQTVKAFFPAATMHTSATVADVAKQSGCKRVVHLASHAHFRHDNPMLSSFALSDRALTLAEISQLSLNAELVTLSGCETGRSRLRGTDVVSLASGFMAAGAQSLLVSSWKAHDSATQMLMRHFYTELCAGARRVDALRTAQIRLIEHGRSHPDDVMFQHPAWWAAFTLLGNWHGLS